MDPLHQLIMESGVILLCIFPLNDNFGWNPARQGNIDAIGNRQGGYN